MAAYTERQRAAEPPPKGRRVDAVPNPAELAAFPRALDLHLEALVDDPAAVAAGHHLHTQLYYFRNYLEQAIQLGVDQVWLIHGLGAGVLRNAIAEELATTQGVKAFRNEYNEKYGMGATLVELG